MRLFVIANLLTLYSAPSYAQVRDFQCLEKLNQNVRIAWEDTLLPSHWLEVQFKVPHANTQRFIRQLPSVQQSNPRFKISNLSPGFDLVQVRFITNPFDMTESLRVSICDTVNHNEAFLKNWFFARNGTVIDGYAVEDDYEWTLR